MAWIIICSIFYTKKRGYGYISTGMAQALYKIRLWIVINGYYTPYNHISFAGDVEFFNKRMYFVRLSVDTQFSDFSNKFQHSFSVSFGKQYIISLKIMIRYFLSTCSAFRSNYNMSIFTT
uniref:Uncharacterized protein n=1 Tax=Babesia bovis TaxID=5865 RepID=S6BA25_BABBO|nr:hypothetical protein [Babesia bovis]